MKDFCQRGIQHYLSMIEVVSGSGLVSLKSQLALLFKMLIESHEREIRDIRKDTEMLRQENKKLREDNETMKQEMKVQYLVMQNLLKRVTNGDDDVSQVKPPKSPPRKRWLIRCASEWTSCACRPLSSKGSCAIHSSPV